MVCILYYAWVRHCEGALTRVLENPLHYPFYAYLCNAFCCSLLYSDDFQVSPDEREEQEFGQRLAWARVSDWIQQQRDKR